jgi:hypothetical protein
MKKKIKIANQELESAKLFKVVAIDSQEGGWISDNATAETMSLVDFKTHHMIKDASKGRIVSSPNFAFEYEEKSNPEYEKIDELLELLEKKRQLIFDNQTLDPQKRSSELNKCEEIKRQLIRQQTSGKIPRFLKSPLPPELIQEFKQAVGNDRKGVYLQWDEELTEGIWYIEFIGNEAERVKLLSMVSDTFKYKDYDLNLSFLKAALEKGSNTKSAKSLKKIKTAQRFIKEALELVPPLKEKDKKETKAPQASLPNSQFEGLKELKHHISNRYNSLKEEIGWLSDEDEEDIRQALHKLNEFDRFVIEAFRSPKMAKFLLRRKKDFIRAIEDGKDLNSFLSSQPQLVKTNP